MAAYTATEDKGSLSEFINKIFESYGVISVEANADEVAGYEKFIEAYKLGMDAEKDLANKFN